MAERPDTVPPEGAARQSKTPLLRVVGMISLSGFTATSARTFGLKVPVSFSSPEARTALISTNPILVYASSMPGKTCFPLMAMTSQFCGRSKSVPTAVILPLSNSKVALVRVLPLTVWIVPPTKAMG